MRGCSTRPLVRRSHAIWRELEAETGQDLLTQCGGLVIEAAGGGAAGHHRHDFLSATIACANHYGIPHERLDAAEVTARFPQFKLDGDESAYYEPGRRIRAAGAMRRCATDGRGTSRRRRSDGTNACWRSSRTPASSASAPIATCTRRRAPSWRSAPGSRTSSTSGSSCSSGSTGRSSSWFALRPGAVDHSPGVMPVFIWGLSDGNAFYGFPEVDGEHTIKVATEQLDVTTTAESASLDVDASETQSTYDELFGPRLPAVSPNCHRAVAVPVHGDAGRQLRGR